MDLGDQRLNFDLGTNASWEDTMALDFYEDSNSEMSPDPSLLAKIMNWSGDEGEEQETLSSDRLQLEIPSTSSTKSTNQTDTTHSEFDKIESSSHHKIASYSACTGLEALLRGANTTSNGKELDGAVQNIRNTLELDGAVQNIRNTLELETAPGSDTTSFVWKKNESSVPIFDTYDFDFGSNSDEFATNPEAYITVLNRLSSVNALKTLRAAFKIPVGTRRALFSARKAANNKKIPKETRKKKKKTKGVKDSETEKHARISSEKSKRTKDNALPDKDEPSTKKSRTEAVPAIAANEQLTNPTTPVVPKLLIKLKPSTAEKLQAYKRKIQEGDAKLALKEAEERKRKEKRVKSSTSVNRHKKPQEPNRSSGKEIRRERVSTDVTDKGQKQKRHAINAQRQNQIPTIRKPSLDDVSKKKIRSKEEQSRSKQNDYKSLPKLPNNPTSGFKIPKVRQLTREEELREKAKKINQKFTGDLKAAKKQKSWEESYTMDPVPHYHPAGKEHPLCGYSLAVTKLPGILKGHQVFFKFYGYSELTSLFHQLTVKACKVANQRNLISEKLRVNTSKEPRFKNRVPFAQFKLTSGYQDAAFIGNQGLKPPKYQQEGKARTYDSGVRGIQARNDGEAMIKDCISLYLFRANSPYADENNLKSSLKMRNMVQTIPRVSRLKVANDYVEFIRHTLPMRGKLHRLDRLVPRGDQKQVASPGYDQNNQWAQSQFSQNQFYGQGSGPSYPSGYYPGPPRGPSPYGTHQRFEYPPPNYYQQQPVHPMAWGQDLSQYRMMNPYRLSYPPPPPPAFRRPY